MEKLLNISLIEGRLTKDPELVNLNNGNQICKFDIAVNETYKIGNENKSSVDFFSINVWNKLAESCSKFLKKGSKVRIKGKLKQDSWVSENGTKHSKVYINANSIEFIDSPKEGKFKEENFREKNSVKKNNAYSQNTIIDPFMETVPF